MILTNLNVKNFRNIENLELDLNKNINIFIGNNAQGKTSILESIYVLALTKASKNLDDIDLIKKNNDFAKISGTVLKSSYKTKLEIVLTKNKKITKVNNNEEKKLQNYISNLNVIMFNPEDLDIIKKSPIVRRNLINIELCQLFNNYMKVLNEYNKILKIRNEYLKTDINKIDKNYLAILTENLVDRALVIMNYRERYILNINNNIDNIYKKLTKSSGLKIIYEKNIDFACKEDIIKLYNDNFYNEVAKKMTLFGPHRDDLSFYLEDMDLKLYGSQGQQRLAVLSFKLAEIALFKEVKKTYPVILLDDIFSELDIEKRNNLIKFIKSNIQFVITTTDIKNISSKILDKASIFKIKNGNLQKGKR